MNWDDVNNNNLWTNNLTQVDLEGTGYNTHLKYFLQKPFFYICLFTRMPPVHMAQRPHHKDFVAGRRTVVAGAFTPRGVGGG